MAMSDLCFELEGELEKALESIEHYRQGPYGYVQAELDLIQAKVFDLKTTLSNWRIQPGRDLPPDINEAEVEPA